MTDKYRDLLLRVSPVTVLFIVIIITINMNDKCYDKVLVDMDGTIVDWDRGFLSLWDGSEVRREDSYFMEQCVSDG